MTEISASSPDSFDDAVKRGVDRAAQTLRNVTSAWVKEQSVRVEGNAVKHYQVNLLFTFVLENDEGMA